MSHASRQLRKALVRAAGHTSRGMRAFIATQAIEMERLWIHADQQMRIVAWGDVPEPRIKLVSVPRSLRRYFGRYVEALS